MMDITSLLQAIEAGTPQASDQLFQFVYDELRQMAARQLAQEKPGQTLQATALVHEAWLRLNGASHRNSPPPPLPGGGTPPSRNCPFPVGANGDRRRYFFAAAGEAMRRILIEHARRKNAERHGGLAQRVEMSLGEVAVVPKHDDLLAVDEALDRLQEHDPSVAELVKLRYFVGMSIPEAAQALGISPRTADAWWAYARAWLREFLDEKGDEAARDSRFSRRWDRSRPGLSHERP